MEPMSSYGKSSKSLTKNIVTLIISLFLSSTYLYILTFSTDDGQKVSLHEYMVRKFTRVFEKVKKSTTEMDGLRDPMGNLVFIISGVDFSVLKALSELLYTGTTTLDLQSKEDLLDILSAEIEPESSIWNDEETDNTDGATLIKYQEQQPPADLAAHVPQHRSTQEGWHPISETETNDNDHSEEPMDAQPNVLNCYIDSDEEGHGQSNSIHIDDADTLVTEEIPQIIQEKNCKTDGDGVSTDANIVNEVQPTANGSVIDEKSLQLHKNDTQEQTKPGEQKLCESSSVTDVRDETEQPGSLENTGWDEATNALSLGIEDNNTQNQEEPCLESPKESLSENIPDLLSPKEDNINTTQQAKNIESSYSCSICSFKTTLKVLLVKHEALHSKNLLSIQMICFSCFFLLCLLKADEFL